jgi:hypothetical protein
VGLIHFEGLACDFDEHDVCSGRSSSTRSQGKEMIAVNKEVLVYRDNREIPRMSSEVCTVRERARVMNR